MVASRLKPPPLKVKPDDRAKKLADEHWEWIEGLWDSLPDDSQFGISTCEYLYKTAFVHGWKHAMADSKQSGGKAE